MAATGTTGTDGELREESSRKCGGNFSLSEGQVTRGKPDNRILLSYSFLHHKENAMIDFNSAINLGEEVLASLEKLYHLVYPASTNATRNTADGKTKAADSSNADAFNSTNLLQFRRKLLSLHAKRHLVTELTATGKLTESEAQAMVDAGSNVHASPQASGSSFANILAWLQANGPTIAQDIAAAIPIIISLLTLFGA
jgi:hypothetical protein